MLTRLKNYSFISIEINSCAKIWLAWLYRGSFDMSIPFLTNEIFIGALSIEGSLSPILRMEVQSLDKIVQYI